MSEAILHGYHFMPTEEELIGILMAFLECKSQGKQLPSSPVVEKFLYGENATPWEILGEDEAWESAEGDGGKKGVKEVVYLLTQLTTRSAKKKSRIAGCGTWDGQTGVKEIENRKGEIIGFRKMLSFKVKDGSESQPDKGQWRMHEYALSGVSLDEMKLKHIHVDNYVICKVTRDYTKYESPRKDKILGKRKSEFGAKTPRLQKNKCRRLIELVNYEASREGQSNDTLIVSSPGPDTTTITTSQESQTDQSVVSSSGDHITVAAALETISKLMEEEDVDLERSNSLAGLNLDIDAVTELIRRQQILISSSGADTTISTAFQEGQIVVPCSGADAVKTAAAMEKTQNLEDEDVDFQKWLEGFDSLVELKLDMDELAGQIIKQRVSVSSSGDDTTMSTAFQDGQIMFPNSGADTVKAAAAAETKPNPEDEEVDFQKWLEGFDSLVELNPDIDEVAEQIMKQPVPPWQFPTSDSISFDNIDIDEVARQIIEQPILPLAVPYFCN